MPGCIPRLVRSWRVGSGSTAPRRTTRFCRNRPDPTSEKSGSAGKSSPRSRRADGCCQRQVGKAHAQLIATGHGTVISRIMVPRQQDQIGRSRGMPACRPGASRRLSGKVRHQPGTSRSPVRYWTKELGHRNKRKALGSSFLCPPFLCHSSSDRTHSPLTNASAPRHRFAPELCRWQWFSAASCSISSVCHGR